MVTQETPFMSEVRDEIAIGRARIWRDLDGETSKSDENATWFGVTNMPEGTSADLFWVTDKEWAFLFRSKESSYMSPGIYSSKEAALEGLKEWLRARAL